MIIRVEKKMIPVPHFFNWVLNSRGVWVLNSRGVYQPTRTFLIVVLFHSLGHPRPYLSSDKGSRVVPLSIDRHEGLSTGLYLRYCLQDVNAVEFGSCA